MCMSYDRFKIKSSRKLWLMVIEFKETIKRINIECSWRIYDDLIDSKQEMVQELGQKPIYEHPTFIIVKVKFNYTFLFPCKLRKVMLIVESIKKIALKSGQRYKWFKYMYPHHQSLVKVDFQWFFAREYY